MQDGETESEDEAQHFTWCVAFLMDNKAQAMQLPAGRLRQLCFDLINSDKKGNHQHGETHTATNFLMTILALMDTTVGLNVYTDGTLSLGKRMERANEQVSRTSRQLVNGEKEYFLVDCRCTSMHAGPKAGGRLVIDPAEYGLTVDVFNEIVQHIVFIYNAKSAEGNKPIQCRLMGAGGRGSYHDGKSTFIEMLNKCYKEDLFSDISTEMRGELDALGSDNLLDCANIFVKQLSADQRRTCLNHPHRIGAFLFLAGIQPVDGCVHSGYHGVRFELFLALRLAMRSVPARAKGRASKDAEATESAGSKRKNLQTQEASSDEDIASAEEDPKRLKRDEISDGKSAADERLPTLPATTTAGVGHLPTTYDLDADTTLEAGSSSRGPPPRQAAAALLPEPVITSAKYARLDKAFQEMSRMNAVLLTRNHELHQQVLAFEARDLAKAAAKAEAKAKAKAAAKAPAKAPADSRPPSVGTVLVTAFNLMTQAGRAALSRQTKPSTEGGSVPNDTTEGGSGAKAITAPAVVISSDEEEKEEEGVV